MERRAGRDPLRRVALGALRLVLARVRLLSGLTMAVFIVSHFLNHALGLVSLAAMEGARVWFVAVWHSWPATILLYGALLGHLGAAFWALLRRRTLRMPTREAAQYVLGFGLPLLILPHVGGTRVLSALTGVGVRYADVVGYLWLVDSGAGATQLLAIAVAWIHVCLGLWFWLRTRTFYPAAVPVLYAFALLIPLLAVLGYVAAGREIADGPDPLGRPGPPADVAARLDTIKSAILYAFAGATALVLAARGARWAAGRSRRIRIRYPGGRVVAVPVGFSILEASRESAIAHLSVCGAKGRCSTCRVRIVETARDLPAPGETEQATLRRIKAAGDVRLACQLRPLGDLCIVPLMAPGAASGAPRREIEDATGQERQVAALFCDLRGFTRLSDGRLPFDVVYLLNRYFAVVGEAVEAQGGHLDKFIGDGALALFGLADTPEVACRQALLASAAIVDGVERLAREVRDEFGAELRVAMGIHVGPAVVGRMGYGAASTLTAIGDTINVASRLEAVAKTEDAQLVVSALVARSAGLRLRDEEVWPVPIRGRTAPLEICIVPEARSWRERLSPAAGSTLGATLSTVRPSQGTSRSGTV